MDLARTATSVYNSESWVAIYVIGCVEIHGDFTAILSSSFNESDKIIKGRFHRINFEATRPHGKGF